MSSLPIARITRPVAICSPDTALADLVNQLLQADSSVGVILDIQQHPLGVVRLHRLLSCQGLASSWPTTGAAPDLPPVSLAATPWVEPIGLLPVSLSLPELCVHLAQRDGGHWAIVTEQGQFLGLLNSALALSWLASQWDRPSSPPWGQPSWPVLAAPSSPKLAASLRLSGPQIGGMVATEPWGGARSPLEKSPLSGGTGTLASPTVTALSTLPLGWQWLDSLPFPLQLQTDTGAVWGQNQAWSQTFGDRPPDVPTAPPAGIGATPLPLRHAYAYICTLDTGEEQVWQFLSLPLPAPGDDRGPVWAADRSPGGNPAPGEASPMRLLAAIEVTPLYTQNQILLAENGELWQQAQAKDEFLLSLSHDIKTPISAILGLASLMQTSAVGPLNPRQQQYIQLIHHNTRLLTTLANQSFELACLDLGQLKLSLKPVDLVAVCERAIAQAQSLQMDLPAVAPSSLATAAPVGVTRRVVQQDWEIDGRAEYLLADELRLCQMLTHLLSNALQFSAATDQVGLRVSRWHPDWLALTVWDTGMGIPEAEQSRIFQKLQRLQFAHSPYPGGVGLGLALTYRLVRLHGGVISFLSEPGVGSEFTLLLPASNPNGSLTQFPRPDAAGRGEMPTAIADRSAIVLVTEPPPQRQTLITPLQALGCRVVVARFPQDLLEKAQCLQPSVIFLDESWLADTDTAILTVLKADPVTAHLPIIATVPDATLTSLLQSQVDGILSLPTQMSLLQSWLERLAVTRGEVKARVPSTQPLTLLALSQLLPDPPAVGPLGSPHPDHQPIDLARVFYQAHHRLLEADDLEQAALLATVWQPDLLLVQGDTLADPASFLGQVQTYPELAKRAIVTLNFSPPASLVQALDLRVFPYQLHSAMDVSHFLTYLQEIRANSPTP